LGAHVYIDAAAEDAAAVLKRMGEARAILATGTSGEAIGPLVSGLAARGKLIVVGVPQDQVRLNAFPLVFGGRSIHGSLTGTPIDGEDTLAFSVLANISPMIETFPLERGGRCLRAHDRGQSTVPSSACYEERSCSACAEWGMTGEVMAT
jgi:D-arabinose 1-dehydrogenase-like Zn-dependent alcohol dehydrogenase